MFRDPYSNCCPATPKKHAGKGKYTELIQCFFENDDNDDDKKLRVLNTTSKALYDVIKMWHATVEILTLACFSYLKYNLS